MKTAMKTDVGHIRSVNEDRVLARAGAEGLTLAVVADGMGGHQAGDIASQVAIDTIYEQLKEVLAGDLQGEHETAVKEAVFCANEKIYSIASSQEHYHGMGTTVVVALAGPERIVVGHIGDSRAYLWNGEHLEQLTEDHSLVNELVKRGQITAEEASHHPRRNVLTRALGTEPFVEVDLASHVWSSGDILLLCSDGLSNMVGFERMIEVVSAAEDLQWKAERLIEYALEAGGEDNITVLLMANEDSDQAGNGVR